MASLVIIAEVVTHVLGKLADILLLGKLADILPHLVFCRKRFLAKALPEPDLKYRSSPRALASSITAMYERRMTGRYLHVEATEPSRWEENRRRRSFVEPT